MPTLTLDAIAGISVDSNDYFNECRTLEVLSTGLVRLAGTLKRREVAWEQQTRGKVKCHVYGLDIDGNGCGEWNASYESGPHSGPYKTATLSSTRFGEVPHPRRVGILDLAYGKEDT